MSFLPFLNDQHNPQIEINLVPKDPFFNTILGKTLRWALSVGRYIVIFTELMVILSFVARFSLDRQVTDLNDSIRQKEIAIQSYGDLEEKVRLIQAKSDQYQQLEQQTQLINIFPTLTEITPQAIQLDELTIKQSSVSVAGQALSQAALNMFINNFQLSGDFYNISVDKIEAEDSDTTSFNFLIRADTQEVNN